LETVKDSTLVRLPPSEDTFKQHVLRSSYQTKIWLIAHIPKPAVALEHGCKDGKFGLEPILFEGHLTFCKFTKLIGWLFQSFEHRVLPDTKERRSGITPS
jgi:hypothetical protein